MIVAILNLIFVEHVPHVEPAKVFDDYYPCMKAWVM
jgi:hypothetical protein